ncbi:MAG TPA: glycosyltransferase family 1 protein [Candidatus Bathyarchaeia archaeon]|nr:glycosyltransferase family 1 protein [Candidatus Bathyarchaeia archaeon]
MRITIDISQIVYGTGVSFYTRNLVKALAKFDKDNQYVLFGTSCRLKRTLIDFGKEVERVNSNFSSKILSLPITLAEYLGNQWRIFPVEKITGPIDVFHSSDWIQPPSAGAKVTTIHDFGFFKYPQTAHPKILAVMKRKLQLVKQEVDFVIAVSQTTKEDTIKYLSYPEEKIKVIYEALQDEVLKPASIRQIAAIKKKYGIEGRYLLALSTIEPRKNLGKIIEAFYLLLKTKPDLSLVVAGKTGWDKKVLELNKRIPRLIFTGYLPTAELAALYSGAYCLVYASLYEGFGMPILGAFACGCPVVTSNLSSMPEIAGKSAVLVDPLKVKSIVDGLRQIEEERETLIKRGFARVKKFTWEKTAQETLKVYEEAYKKRKT